MVSRIGSNPRIFVYFQGMSSIYNNPELEMMAKEIQAMLSEKLSVEKDVQDTEYSMSVKSTEIHSLQSEYDTLAATLKQLTNQKDVAQKRLDALDEQVHCRRKDFSFHVRIARLLCLRPKVWQRREIRFGAHVSCSSCKSVVILH
jgi:septal ring factor EnvC (AmiA/AmiB activator)